MDDLDEMGRGFEPLENRVVVTRCGRIEIVRVIDEYLGASRELSRTVGGDNPYLDAYLAASKTWVRARSFRARFRAQPDERTARRGLVRQFAWAVPCETALAALAELGPIVEVAAGTGYWANLLAARGVDVIATDRQPVSLPDDPFERTASYFAVAKIGAAATARLYPNRALLLVWPPHAKPMAANALAAYAGDAVVVIGEHGEATADDRFFRRLRRDWVLERWIPIPQWSGIRDDLTIWRRRA